MTESLRRWLAPLRRTPLHPQWFCFRDELLWLKQVAAGSQGLVLDVGCGRQRVRPFLDSRCAYLGIDYPQTALGYQARPEVFADGTRLPFIDASVDTVLALEVLEHIPDSQSVVAESVRVLRPGGTLIVSVPFLYPLHDAPYDFTRWTPIGLRTALERAGLVVERLDTLGTPLTSAALLANIAIAKTTQRLLNRRHWLSVFALPLSLLAIPIINVLGWSLQWIAPDPHFMPFTSRALAKKPEIAR